MDKPAEQLEGITLPGGWKVIHRFVRPRQATGGNFSVGYMVEKSDGRRAFLKALDYSDAFATQDPALVLQAMTTAYNFERDLLNRCRDANLNRIVVPIDDGSIQIDPANIYSVVQYIILELAEGDVRSRLTQTKSFDLAWALRSLHHISVGMLQLHSRDVVHQDVKPSNVLVFGPTLSKLTDVGQASIRGTRGPNDDSIGGDPAYLPPEVLYEDVSPTWDQRLACDAYLLGSMVVFFFVRTGMTGLLLSKLPASQHWKAWGGDYEQVLPYLRHAFGQCVFEIAESVPKRVRIPIESTIRQLCEPDPGLRGHPLNRAQIGNSYSLLRYPALFDTLAKKVELDWFPTGGILTQ